MNAMLSGTVHLASTVVFQLVNMKSRSRLFCQKPNHHLPCTGIQGADERMRTTAGHRLGADDGGLKAGVSQTSANAVVSLTWG